MATKRTRKRLKKKNFAIFMLIVITILGAIGFGIKKIIDYYRYKEITNIEPFEYSPTPTPTITPTPTPTPTFTPTPTPTPTPDQEVTLILIHNAYLIDAPSPKGEIIEHLVVDDEVILVDDSDKNYMLVRYNDQEGYINKKYLSKLDETETKKEEPEETEKPNDSKQSYSYSGEVLTAVKGVVNGPSGKETYYNLDMTNVVTNTRNSGIQGDYWIREDGVKMFGEYILAACDVSGVAHNRYDLVETSVGIAICADTGAFAATNPQQIDIATTW